MKTTIAELYESGERFAAVIVHFPSGHVEVEGRIRRVPCSFGGGVCNYWVGQLCLRDTTTIKSAANVRDDEPATWDVYSSDNERA